MAIHLCFYLRDYSEQFLCTDRQTDRQTEGHSKVIFKHPCYQKKTFLKQNLKKGDNDVIHDVSVTKNN
jgi:hypothetical protein